MEVLEGGEHYRWSLKDKFNKRGIGRDKGQMEQWSKGEGSLPDCS